MADLELSNVRGLVEEYEGNGQHSWEQVVDDGDVKRLRVPGGWIYAIAHYSEDEYEAELISANAVFVPLPAACASGLML